MQDVPKIVRRQLKASNPMAEVHPDADLLTAFAEHSLDAMERDSVVDHLARCADCRDVVALALPAMEATAVSATSDVRIGWFRLPALRWGVVAAGLLAVTSVGVQQYKRRHHEQIVASNLAQRKDTTEGGRQNVQAPQRTLAPKTAPMPSIPEIRMPKEALSALPQTSEAAGGAVPPSSRNFLQLQPLRPAKGAGSTSARSPKTSTVTAGGVGSGSGAGYASSDSQDSTLAQSAASPAPAQQQNSTSAQAQRAFAPSSSEVVEVQSEAAQITTQTSQNQVQDQLIQNRKDKELPLNGRNVANLDAVAKAKDPVPAPAATATAVPTPAPGIPQQTSAVMVSVSPRWTINSAGTLLRSLDDGKTWQEISPAAASVAASTAVASTAATDLYVTNQSVAAEDISKRAKKNQKSKSSPNPTPVFRSVAASGLEVWAGGSSGMLYHTVDGGTRWTLILPSAAGATLAGDITSIQFPDPQHGTVATSNAEIWTTADEGQTWHKQQ
jgi:photosystem II stability/assembly factor-like uncharacterized protein